MHILRVSEGMGARVQRGPISNILYVLASFYSEFTFRFLLCRNLYKYRLQTIILKYIKFDKASTILT